MNVEETEGDALRRIAGQNVELLAEVSRLGQRLQRTEEMARVEIAEGVEHWDRADAAEAERDAALALVGQLQGQLDAVRAIHQPRVIDACMDDDEHQGETCDCGTKQIVCAGCFKMFADIIGPWTDNPIPLTIAWPCPTATAVLSDREGTPNE